MNWRDFAPYVMPYVIGCPMPVLVHHARLTAIDWCRKTLAMQRDLDPVLATGASNDVAITPPAGYTTVRVMAVGVDGKDRELVHPRLGQQYVRTQHPGDFCFTSDSLTLSVYPLEAANTPVVVSAALMPALGTSTELDDDVALQYAADIAHGVISAIKLLPDFKDEAGAATHQALYRDARSTVAAKVMRGLSAAKTKSSPKLF